MLRIFKKEDQTFGQFNGGEIIENKPIGFPHEAFVLKPFSNLFYWAHAIATKDSTIGLHPHKGFEILTYVLKGKIRHYDTKIEKWVSLKKGDVQLIQSGSGISHSEHLYDKSEIFQIWFDPDLSKSLNKEPQYKDYKEKEFENINGIKTIIGTSCKPAFCAANHLLSPATISYGSDEDLFFLTAIGWIIPFFFID